MATPGPVRRGRSNPYGETPRLVVESGDVADAIAEALTPPLAALEDAISQPTEEQPMSVITNAAGVPLAIDKTHEAARMSLRPLDHMIGGKIRGHYRLSMRSGLITGAGVLADATLFSFRWADPAVLAVLTFLEAFYTPLVVFAAEQELALKATQVSSFTARDSAGAAASLTGGSNRVRKNMGPSQVDEIRMATTTLLTAGTRTLDAQDFCAGGGLANVVNAAAGTQYVNPGGGPVPFGFRFAADLARGEHPIIMSQLDGFIIRNAVVFGATGTARLTVNMAWSEVEQY